MRADIDYSVYLVTDRELMSAATVEECVEQAIRGGATAVQLREKQGSTAEFFAEAVRVREICKKYRVPLIINDRVDVALACGADGVHIGQSDLPADVVRQLIGKEMLLGVSASTLQEAEKAAADGADYLGVGAMFSTSTKTDAEIVTKECLKEITRRVNLPVVIIGGINERTLPEFSDCEIDGAAVVSAIVAQKDIAAASKRIKAAFEKGRRKILRGKDAALFDLDGTLLDSLGVWAELDERFLKRRGLAVPEDYAAVTAAMSMEESANYTVARFGLPESAKELIAEWKELLREEYAERVDLKPGALSYLNELKSSGVRLAVVTSLSRELCDPALKRNGIFGLFEQIFSVEEVGVGKQSGEIFRHALNRLGVTADRAVLFEDVPDAVRSGKSVGLYAVGVADKHSVSQADELKKECDLYLADFSLPPIFK